MVPSAGGYSLVSPFPKSVYCFNFVMSFMDFDNIDVDASHPPGFNDIECSDSEPSGSGWTRVGLNGRGSKNHPKHVGGGSVVGELNGIVGLDNEEECFNSNGKVIVVIEPSVESGKDVYENLLFNSEVRKRALLSSVIGEYLRCIKSVRVSRDKKRLILELINRNDDFHIPEEKVRQIYGIKMLGGCRVQCRKPKGKPDILTGVIQGYHQLSCIDNVVSDLKIQNFSFRKVYRLMKNVNGVKVPTASVLVEFVNLECLPKKVYVDFCEYRIRNFEPEPVRCYKCQKFNHLARNCLSKVDVCAKCSKEHPTKECSNDQQPGTSSDSLVKCFNCKGDHPAYSKECPDYQRVKKALKVQNSDKISYASALKLVRKNNEVKVVGTAQKPSTPRNIDDAPRQDPRSNTGVTEEVKNLISKTCSIEIQKLQIPSAKVDVKDILSLLKDERVAEEIFLQVFPAQLFANTLHKIFGVCFPAARLTKEMKQKSALIIEAMIIDYKESLKSSKKRGRENASEDLDVVLTRDLEGRKKSKNNNNGRKN